MFSAIACCQTFFFFYIDYLQRVQDKVATVSEISQHTTVLPNEGFTDVPSDTLYMIIGKFVLFTEASCRYAISAFKSVAITAPCLCATAALRFETDSAFFPERC